MTCYTPPGPFKQCGHAACFEAWENKAPHRAQDASIRLCSNDSPRSVVAIVPFICISVLYSHSAVRPLHFKSKSSSSQMHLYPINIKGMPNPFDVHLPLHAIVHIKWYQSAAGVSRLFHHKLSSRCGKIPALMNGGRWHVAHVDTVTIERGHLHLVVPWHGNAKSLLTLKTACTFIWKGMRKSFEIWHKRGRGNWQFISTFFIFVIWNCEGRLSWSRKTRIRISRALGIRAFTL